MLITSPTEAIIPRFCKAASAVAAPVPPLAIGIMLDVVKGYQAHEKTVLTELVKLRSGMTMAEKNVANQKMEQLTILIQLFQAILFCILLLKLYYYLQF